MKKEYKRLFSPIKINGLELKNRIMMPAVHTVYTPEGYINERFKQFYFTRAEGGVGLIVIGGCAYDKYGSNYAMVRLDDDKYLDGLKEFTDGIHERGSKIAVQLYQAGRYARSTSNEGRTPIAPSAVYSSFSRETPREMTKEDMEHVIASAEDAAERVIKAGFDLIEICGSAGYLISQFLSPVTNLRTDEYGGSWENRLRFPIELVRRLRKKVNEVAGPDFPLTMRIAGNDLVPGSNRTAEAAAFAKVMEAEGIDMINVTGGWHESRVPQITADLPRGGFSGMSAEIRDAVSIPVAIGNRVSDPDTAELILALGKADMVSLGRPHIADPDWAKKAAAGRPELIRNCLGCNQGCLARTFFGKPVGCLVNGEAGREYEIEHKVTDDPKNILVIGGGPGGCEFAFRAAERGHHVTLWEKAGRLGGQLHIAARPPHKEEFLQPVRFYENMLPEAGVEVITGKEAAADSPELQGFDMIVVATGRGEPLMIPLDNEEGVPVYTAEDILTKKAFAGRNVIVVGGGTVGCETAHYLACEASPSAAEIHHMIYYGYETDERIHELMNRCRRKISIVDMDKIGKGFEAGTAWPLMQDLKRFGVKKLPFTKLGKIAGGKAKAAGKDKEGNAFEVELPCDTIVLATGAKPGDGLFKALKEKGLPVFNIGDSEHLGNVISAVEAACRLAESL